MWLPKLQNTDLGEASSWPSWDSVAAIFSCMARFSFRKRSKRRKIFRSRWSGWRCRGGFLSCFFLGLSSRSTWTRIWIIQKKLNNFRYPRGKEGWRPFSWKTRETGSHDIRMRRWRTDEWRAKSGYSKDSKERPQLTFEQRCNTM